MGLSSCGSKPPEASAPRICFVSTLPITLSTFVRPQAVHLAESGWIVSWACAADDEFSLNTPSGIVYHPLQLKRGIDIFGVPRAVHSLYELFRFGDFDIVQYSTPNAAFYASTAAWLARVPVRLYAQWGVRYVGFTGLKRWLFKAIEAWTCARSTIVEPDSHGNVEFSVSEELYPRAKARVIWNGSACGIDLARFAVSKKSGWRSRWRELLGLDADSVVVGFVGSLRRDKGSNELLAAFRSVSAEFPEARLLLVGDLEFLDTIEPDLRTWMTKSEQVVHAGTTSEVPQHMACMDVFVLPSYREGFGMVVIEAEAMGVPVIVSDVPGPTDAMVPGQTGLVVPVRDSASLADALRTLLSDEALRERMGADAVRFACSGFEQNEFLCRAVQDKQELLDAVRSERITRVDSC